MMLLEKNAGNYGIKKQKDLLVHHSAVELAEFKHKLEELRHVDHTHQLDDHLHDLGQEFKESFGYIGVN
jgi:hypothetical protein